MHSLTTNNNHAEHNTSPPTTSLSQAQTQTATVPPTQTHTSPHHKHTHTTSSPSQPAAPLVFAQYHNQHIPQYTTAYNAPLFHQANANAAAAAAYYKSLQQHTTQTHNPHAHVYSSPLTFPPQPPPPPPHPPPHPYPFPHGYAAPLTSFHSPYHIAPHPYQQPSLPLVHYNVPIAVSATSSTSVPAVSSQHQPSINDLVIAATATGDYSPSLIEHLNQLRDLTRTLPPQQLAAAGIDAAAIQTIQSLTDQPNFKQHKPTFPANNTAPFNLFTPSPLATTTSLPVPINHSTSATVLNGPPDTARFVSELQQQAASLKHSTAAALYSTGASPLVSVSSSVAAHADDEKMFSKRRHSGHAARHSKALRSSSPSPSTASSISDSAVDTHSNRRSHDGSEDSDSDDDRSLASNDSNESINPNDPTGAQRRRREKTPEEKRRSESLRKSQHQKSDKQRRAKIKEGMEQLKALVSMHGKLESPDQASIVIASVELVNALRTEITALKNQIDQAKNESASNRTRLGAPPMNVGSILIPSPQSGGLQNLPIGQLLTTLGQPIVIPPPLQPLVVQPNANAQQQTIQSMSNHNVNNSPQSHLQQHQQAMIAIQSSLMAAAAVQHQQQQLNNNSINNNAISASSLSSSSSSSSSSSPSPMQLPSLQPNAQEWQSM